MKSRLQLGKEIAAAKLSDPFAGREAKQVAAFYGRVADFVEGKVGVGRSLAAQFLRHWLTGKGAPLQIPPGKLTTNLHIASYLREEVRPVLLSQKPVFRKSGPRPVLGAAVRIRDTESGKTITRDAAGVPIMEYEGPPVGTIGFWEAAAIMDKSRSAELNAVEKDTLDIFTSYHKFALTSKVSFQWSKLRPGSYRVEILKWECSAKDSYDFNQDIGFPVPNPDRGSKASDAIAPDSDFVFLEHANAQPLLDAGLAHNFQITTTPWTVADASLVRSEVIQVV